MISGSLDWLGSLLAIVAFGSLTAGLTFISGTSGAHALVIPALCFGAIALVLFVFHEARAASPVMPLSLFGSVFLSANIMTLFVYGALAGILFLLPFDLIERRGMSATQVGLTLLPIGIIIGTLSRFAGVWAEQRPAGPSHCRLVSRGSGRRCTGIQCGGLLDWCCRTNRHLIGGDGAGGRAFNNSGHGQRSR